jgi:hypothetical protein
MRARSPGVRFALQVRRHAGIAIRDHSDHVILVVNHGKAADIVVARAVRRFGQGLVATAPHHIRGHDLGDVHRCS